MKHVAVSSRPPPSKFLEMLNKMAVLLRSSLVFTITDFDISLFNRQKGNIQALRGSKFAKFSKGCAHPRLFSWMTHSFRSQEKKRFQVLISLPTSLFFIKSSRLERRIFKVEGSKMDHYRTLKFRPMRFKKHVGA